MSTTPTGDPVWIRNADASTYGGNSDKRDYQSQGVVNPQTDVSAADFLRLTADVAALARTVPFAVLSVTCSDTSPAAPTISSVNQMTGVNVSGYVGDAAPTGMPSGSRNGTGDVTLTWDSSYTDEFGVSGNLAIVGAHVTPNGTTAGRPVYELVDDTTVRVRCFNGAGAALTDGAFTISIFT